MSAESPRHVRGGAPLTVPAQPPSDRSLIDAVSGFINDVTLSASSTDPRDVIQWARFETADINEPIPEGENDSEISPLLLILGYGAGVQVWLIPPSGEAQEVLSWRQGTVKVLRVLPTPIVPDTFLAKRPLIALCDSASPGPMFCSLSFISVRGGEQVKSIKFKNPILDVQANKHSVVVSFSERFAVFDAGSLEDRLSVTTCYPCPCPLGGAAPINPIALGDRWLAYADRKINPSKRSSGGCEGEGVSSYTATVLHAAKSLSKGLRGLGESVAHSLAGGRATSQSPSPPNTDLQQPGVITIMDIEGYNEDECQDSEESHETVVAHFVAHSDAVIALKFDAGGMLLVTADRRGHDFHVFRINPHPCGPSLASVHHLYILHRGDTTARVQDIAISADSRWTAISSLRGTTHIFPITPYGGACGVRTHTQPRVVNRLSRFHRSAGLPLHGPTGTVTPQVSEGMSWFPNPRVPPYPQPVTCAPLAQLRPTAAIPTHTITRTSSGRQRLSSLSEEGGAAPLLARARFGTPPPAAGTSGTRTAHHALYLVAANGHLIHYQLHVKPASNVAKEKVCDETGIELEVEAVSQWPLQRPPAAADLLAPLPPTSPLLQPLSCRRSAEVGVSEEERWLSQVEIVTHAGPHRRLWMGPQFVFKTYTCTGSSSSLSEAETVEVDTSVGALPRSNPVNMPGARPLVPVLIDSGSASSLEHSPSDSFRRKSMATTTERTPVCDVQLKEDLAEAMKEDHGSEERRASVSPRRASPGSPLVRAVDPAGTVVQQSGTAQPAELSSSPPAQHNRDEATFRPVVRAPAPLSPALSARPLPRTTFIPAAAAPPRPRTPPGSPDAPAPLATHVLIPAAIAAEPHPLPERYTSPTLKTADSIRQDRTSFKTTEPTAEFALKLPSSIEEKAETSSAETDMETLELTESNQKRICDGVDDTGLFVVKESNKYDVEKTPVHDLSCELEMNVPSVHDDVNVEPVSKPMISTGAISKLSRRPCDSPRRNLGSEFEYVYHHDKEVELVKEREITRKTKELGRNDVKYDLPRNYKGEIIDVGGGTYSGVEISLRDHSRSIREGRPINQFREKLPLTQIREGPPTTQIREGRPITQTVHQMDIKTEEQAWDMLLSESDKTSSAASSAQFTEDKLKPKRNRKSKSKPFHDEASFIEIHNITDTQAEPTTELVSLSPGLDSYPTGSCAESLSPSSTTRPEPYDSPVTYDENDDAILTETSSERHSDESIAVIQQDTSFDDDIFYESKSDNISNISKSHVPSVNVVSDCQFSETKDDHKSRKAKSLSPFQEKSKSKSEEKRAVGSEDKNVIVIDSTGEDFPDIKITRGKMRKKPPVAVKKEEVEVIDKPVKTWSSVAASKQVKKYEEPHFEEVSLESESMLSSDTLQDKLIELCKRPDVIVAQCDAPAEMKHVEQQHHATSLELPPLESLEFAFEDLKLGVMRDSMLESSEVKVTSPLSKINIDDILSSIKEATTSAIDSSSFKTVDKNTAKGGEGSKVSSEKVAPRDKDVSFVEVAATKPKKEETAEKSSDDETTVTSQTDSDKILTQPSPKLSKPKKSRKKKK